MVRSNVYPFEFRTMFLVYRSRSGSTFFADRIGRHPEVVVLPESNVLSRLIYYNNDSLYEYSHDNLIDFLMEEQKFRDWDIPKEHFDLIFSKYSFSNWRDVYLLICEAYRTYYKPHAKVVIMKKGGWYYSNMPVILKVFQGALFIAMIRDPRGIYNSASKAIHSESGQPLAKSVIKHAWSCKRYMGIIMNAAHKYEGCIKVFKYEDVVAQLEKSLNEAWNFMGVRLLDQGEYIKIMKKKDASHLITDSTKHLHDNVALESQTLFSNKWKRELSISQKLIIKTICRKGLKYYNYLLIN